MRVNDRAIWMLMDPQCALQVGTVKSLPGPVHVFRDLGEAFAVHSAMEGCGVAPWRVHVLTPAGPLNLRRDHYGCFWTVPPEQIK